MTGRSAGWLQPRPVLLTALLLIAQALAAGLDWIEQCFTSPPTQYRLYGRRFLQVKRPNQQYQSIEGESCKGKNPKNKENTNSHA